MAKRRLPGSGAADLPSGRRLWLGQTVDARVVCDSAEWIGGYGICRGEWSAAGNVADADATAPAAPGDCGAGSPSRTRHGDAGAGFRLAVVTGDLEHSAVKGSPPRHDQRPGGGGFAVQLRVAGLEPCQLFERLQHRPRRPVPSGPRPRPAGPQPTSTGRRSSRCRRGCPIEPVTAGRRPAPPPVPQRPSPWAATRAAARSGWQRGSRPRSSTGRPASARRNATSHCKSSSWPLTSGSSTGVLAGQSNPADPGRQPAGPQGRSPGAKAGANGVIR
jgi:hypothetical protein